MGTVRGRHPDVQQDEGDLLAIQFEQVDRLRPARGGPNLKTLLLQVALQHFSNRGFVVHNQDDSLLRDVETRIRGGFVGENGSREQRRHVDGLDEGVDDREGHEFLGDDPRRGQDDRHPSQVIVPPHDFQHAVAAAPGHFKVKNQQVRQMRPKFCNAFESVRGRLDMKEKTV